MTTTRPIGIFDSGFGGISVLRQLKEYLPNEHYLYYGDSAYAPYGTKSKEEITERCRTICQAFMKQNVKMILIACNTATSAAADQLRKEFPVPIIGMEPALKVAAHGKRDQHILVMATELTLKEKKFEQLMKCYEKENTIIKLPCPKLVELVEHGHLEDKKLVIDQLQEYFQMVDIQKMNSIVLGCTHFIFFKQQIEALLPDIQVVDGNMGTIRHMKKVLMERKELSAYHSGSVVIKNSKTDPVYLEISQQLLKK